jgi:hypothetical protein
MKPTHGNGSSSRKETIERIREFRTDAEPIVDDRVRRSRDGNCSCWVSAVLDRLAELTGGIAQTRNE